MMMQLLPPNHTTLLSMNLKEAIENVKAGNGVFRGRFLVRDKFGRPKIERRHLDAYWQDLTDEDKAYLLEVHDGYNPPSGS